MDFLQEIVSKTEYTQKNERRKNVQTLQLESILSISFDSLLPKAIYSLALEPRPLLRIFR